MVSNIEVEASQFARIVEEIEKLIRDGGQAGPGYPLAAVLGSAQGRLDSLHAEEEHAAVEKKEKEEKDRSAIVAMVERETKLNEEEKKKYAEFLSKDHFTRSDINDLSTFYADGGAYDRLSDGGKEQMDHRIEEGIRRGELSRDELPDHVIKKALRGESREADAKEKSSSRGNEASILEAENQSANAAGMDANLKVQDEREETSESKQKAKPAMPDGLGGLASLSPVQETESVVVPQTGKDGSSRQIGG